MNSIKKKCYQNPFNRICPKHGPFELAPKEGLQAFYNTCRQCNHEKNLKRLQRQKNEDILTEENKYHFDKFFQICNELRRIK